MDAKGFIDLFESKLTVDQVQLIKDTIRHGWWGDGSGNIIALYIDSNEEFDKLTEWSKG